MVYKKLNSCTSLLTLEKLCVILDCTPNDKMIFKRGKQKTGCSIHNMKYPAFQTRLSK